jgi:hypothetical protein
VTVTGAAAVFFAPTSPLQTTSHGELRLLTVNF